MNTLKIEIPEGFEVEKFDTTTGVVSFKEKSNEKEIVFTGSKPLMDMIEQVPKEKFPFSTIIVQEEQMF